MMKFYKYELKYYTGEKDENDSSIIYNLRGIVAAKTFEEAIGEITSAYGEYLVDDIKISLILDSSVLELKEDYFNHLEEGIEDVG